MSRIVFVNGAFVPYEEARIPIMDRGFLFADGIYEVSAVIAGRLVDSDAHLARLDRSLNEIRIANPYSSAEWTRLCEELVRRNLIELHPPRLLHALTASHPAPGERIAAARLAARRPG